MTSSYHLLRLGRCKTILDITHTKVQPIVQQLWLEMSGVEAGGGRRQLIETRHGSFAGGYFPSRYEQRDDAPPPRVFPDSTIAGVFGPRYVRAYPDKNFEKHKAVSLNWDLVPMHISSVIHDLVFGEYIRDKVRLFFNREFLDVISRVPPELSQVALPWFRHLARLYPE